MPSHLCTCLICLLWMKQTSLQGLSKIHYLLIKLEHASQSETIDLQSNVQASQQVLNIIWETFTPGYPAAYQHLFLNLHFDQDDYKLNSREPVGLDRDSRDSVWLWEENRQYVLRCMYSMLPGGCFDVCMHPRGGFGLVQIQFVTTHAYEHTQTGYVVWPRNKAGILRFDHTT